MLQALLETFTNAGEWRAVGLKPNIRIVNWLVILSSYLVLKILCYVPCAVFFITSSLRFKKGSSRTFANIGQDVKKWIMSSSSLWHSKQVAGIGLDYWVNLYLSICNMNVAVIILAFMTDFFTFSLDFSCPMLANVREEPFLNPGSR
jgi:hypothetical protein